MKKISIIIALFVGASLVSLAQQGPGFGPQGRKQHWQGKIDSLSPEKIAEIMTDRMAKDLSLTDEQKAKVYEINLKRAKEMKSLRSEIVQQRQKYRSQIKANNQERLGEIEKVLTPEQNSKWKQQREEHSKLWRERREQWLKERWDNE